MFTQMIKAIGITTLFATTLLFLGCKSATRMSITPKEANHHFTIRHSQPPAQAFSKVELALAEAYNDLPQVLKLKQPESGTFLLKPLVAYQVGGPLGPVQNARYSLKIVVSVQTVNLDFELGREETTGWNSYAPETQVPKIRGEFQAIAEHVAMAIGGTLE